MADVASPLAQQEAYGNAFRNSRSEIRNEFCSMSRPHFCSMKIMEDVRKYAAEHGLTEPETVESGMEEKKKEFLQKGAEFYINA